MTLMTLIESLLLTLTVVKLAWARRLPLATPTIDNVGKGKVKQDRSVNIKGTNVINNRKTIFVFLAMDSLAPFLDLKQMLVIIKSTP